MPKKPWQWALLLVASAINIAPMLLFNLGGDIDFHFVLIDCFARQFWQGDLYPRWCIDANAGLGAPLFLFYFPLPYYVAALLFPLTHIGLPLYGIYVLSMALATFITGLTCYSWLKDIVSPERALLAAALFLFMPYRMEAMLFRMSYAEIWCMALLPLLMKHTRQLARGDDHAAVPLAGVLGLIFLTHLPAAMAAIIASGIYLLYMRPTWRYGASLLWGAAIASFYLVPAIYYKRFMIPQSEIGEQPWANSFLSAHNIIALGQGRIVMTIALSMLSFALLAAYLIYKRARISDAFMQRELLAWGTIFAVALVLLLPVSAPLYALIGPLAAIAFPWRMQNMFPLALVFLLAVWMQWFTTEKRLKTWKADFFALFLLMALLSYFVIGVRDEGSAALGEKIRQAEQATEPEYRTIWTDEHHFNRAYMFARYDNKASTPATAIVTGHGTAKLESRAWGGFDIATMSTTGMTLRIDHSYFPIWSATTGKGLPLALYSEPATGQMLINVPIGAQHILLTHDITQAKAWLIITADLASALATLFWLLRFKRSRHSFDNPENAC